MSPARRFLAEFLKERRKAARLRQRDVSKKLRKEIGWMQRIEAGHQKLHVLDLIELSRVLHFNPGRLVARIGNTQRGTRQ
jgi:transcriptional regulator with XRE-family HTH domain